ncbi:MAG: protein-L-isoaspartate(D-aspartate) O-methyltransferase [Nitrospirae bacterium]|nr:protein-L-isoaspartate(D-aspartate) O-methyltransferase [Nitrospirota bacterium]
MIEAQLKPRGIKDVRVLEAILGVPRHLFVSKDNLARAYSDMALDIGMGQTISQPYMVAVMTELLEIGETSRVLEIGTGSGYQTAILAELAMEVYSIERIDYHSETAAKRLKELGYENVSIKTGDGTLGWPEKAPFDRILITAAAPDVPVPLMEQLADDGILVSPVGERHTQQLWKVVKSGGKVLKEFLFPCVFVPLIGQHGWAR